MKLLPAIISKLQAIDFRQKESMAFSEETATGSRTTEGLEGLWLEGK